MRVLALGGPGDMGRMAVAVLLESSKITSITVADINMELAEDFVDIVGSEKLTPFHIDINDKEKLVSLMKSHNIVINTVGPFYIFEKQVIEAVIEAKIPCVDICDDWKPSLEAVEKTQQAERVGIPIIIGLGASPGITNLLAVLAASKLDEVDTIITAWGESINIKEGRKPKHYISGKQLKKKPGDGRKQANAAIVHWLYETLEKIPTYLNGEMVEIESLTETEPFDFPGYKPMYACHIGHPEPVTLPRTIKARTISNVMYVGETLTGMLRSYRDKILRNLMTIEAAACALEEDIKRITRRVMMGQTPLKEYLGGPPMLSAIAFGKKNGKKLKVSVALARNPHGEMAGVTGVPLAIGALMIIDGKIKKNGILCPEEAIEPRDFFSRLAPYCGKSKAEDILIIREDKIKFINNILM